MTSQLDDGPTEQICCSGRAAYRCDGTVTNACREDALWLAGEPERVALTVTTTAGAEYDGMIEPVDDGEPHRPNGAFCDPVCRGASELVELQ